jgi:hypothetical protein
MGIREIVVDAKKKKGEVSRIMEERKTEAEAEYEETKLRRLIAEEKARIDEVQGKGQAVDRGLASSFTENIMRLARVEPAKAKEFLNSLDEETMSKMAYLMALENDRTGAFLKIAQSPSTDAKTLVDLAKLLHSNGGTDLKGIAELLKVGIDMGKASNPQPQTLEQGANLVLGIIKPFQEMANTAQQTALNAQIEAIKAQIPPSLETQITNLKTMTEKLGLGGGSEKLTELNLELEKMRQSHDIDMESIRWEKEKFLLGKESDTEKWDKIAGMFNPIFQMPEIRDTIRNIGASVGKSISGATNPSTTTQPQIVGFVCPNCNAELSVPLPPNAPEEVPIKCPKCGTITPAKLSKPASETPPPEEKPTSTRLKAIYT